MGTEKPRIASLGRNMNRNTVISKKGAEGLIFKMCLKKPVTYFHLLFSAANFSYFKFAFYYMFLKIYISQHQNILM